MSGFPTLICKEMLTRRGKINRFLHQNQHSCTAKSRSHVQKLHSCTAITRLQQQKLHSYTAITRLQQQKCLPLQSSNLLTHLNSSGLKVQPAISTELSDERSATLGKSTAQHFALQGQKPKIAFALTERTIRYVHHNPGCRSFVALPWAMSCCLFEAIFKL